MIHQNRFKYILKAIKKLGLKKGARILDVGCYPLDLFNELVKEGFEVSGISSEHEKVRQKGVVVLNIETEPLPFEKNQFDLVLFSEVMEHLVNSPKIYLQKFREVLRPGGFLLITTPNAVHIKHRVELLFGKTQNFPLFQFEDSIYHRHNREFTLPELEEVLRKAEFEIVSAKYFNAYGPGRKKLHQERFGVRLSKHLGFMPTIIFPTLRDSLFVLAQKP